MLRSAQKYAKCPRTLASSVALCYALLIANLYFDFKGKNAFALLL